MDELIMMEDQTIISGEESASAEEEKAEKMYTEKELNEQIDSVVARRIARERAKLERNYNRELSKYKELEGVVNAGIGTESLDDAISNLREFYEGRGVDLPKSGSEYSDNDLNILAKNEADTIINLGLEEVNEELERLTEVGFDDMSTREKLVFKSLAEYKKAESGRQELKSIGVTDETISSQEFKDFARQFNSDTPIKTIYEIYSKAHGKSVEKIGSLKSGSTQYEKEYYSPEDVDRLTPADLDNPKIFEAVRKSMSKWK